MGVRTWTPAMIRQLKKEYPYITNPRDLAKTLRVTYIAMKTRVTILKLKRRVPNYHQSSATKAEDKFIIDNYMTMPEKRMATRLGRSHTFVNGRLKKLKLKKPKWLIEKFRKESQIKPGNISFNKGKKWDDFMTKESQERSRKGCFKKGEPNHNEKHDGAITIRHSIPDRGGIPHKYIRVSKGVWKELQIYNWEKKNGAVPKDHVLACKDGDTLNCDPSNWFPLSKKDNALRNSGSLNLSDGYVAMTIAGKNHPQLIPELKQNKKLIEVKRQLIILKRTINDTTGNPKQA